jgi:hypothetical protein
MIKVDAAKQMRDELIKAAAAAAAAAVVVVVAAPDR